MLYETLRGVEPLRKLYHTAIYWNACDVIHAPAAEAVLRLLIRELLRRENRAAPQKGTFEKTNRAPHRLRGKGTTHTL